MITKKSVIAGCASVAAMFAVFSHAHAQDSGSVASFFFDSEGKLVPMTQNGVPFESCSDLPNGRCNLAKSKLTELHLQSSSEATTNSLGDGYCELIVITHNGKTYYFYDPTDPDCPPF